MRVFLGKETVEICPDSDEVVAEGRNLVTNSPTLSLTKKGAKYLLDTLNGLLGSKTPEVISYYDTDYVNKTITHDGVTKKVCENCNETKETCEFFCDPYNTDGDCLASR